MRAYITSPTPFQYLMEPSNLFEHKLRAGTAYPSGAHGFIPCFQRSSCYQIFSFLCNVLQIVVCPFSFSHHSLRLLITPLVSSNFCQSVKLFETGVHITAPYKIGQAYTFVNQKLYWSFSYYFFFSISKLTSCLPCCDQ